MKIKIKQFKHPLILAFLVIVFFLATSSFNYLTQTPDYVKWSSPDETANYFFSKSLSEGQGLSFFDQAAIIGDNMVMPRSVRSDAGWLKPVSFLGIILVYGSLGSIFGVPILPFLTPAFAALGIIFFYLLIKKIFNPRLALISSFLLASFPVYIYYTVRSMFHNVLFIVLLIIGIYFLISSTSKFKNFRVNFNDFLKKEIWLKFLSSRFSGQRFFGFLLAFLGGIFIGLAAITRTSEMIWFLPAAFLAWLFYIKRLGFIKLIIALCGFFLALIPNIYFNQLLYSSPFYGGYNEMNRSIDDISLASSGLAKSLFKGSGQTSQYLNSIYSNVFYFGFNEKQSVYMAKHYILDMFTELSVVFTLGVILLLVFNIRKPRKKYFAYFSVFAVLSLILIFYYGSWQFNDNPDPNRFTIGNSYTRYWLPIYLMMMPIAALAIVKFSQALLFIYNQQVPRWRRLIADGIQTIIVFSFVFIGINFVLYGSEEGLSHLYYNTLREKSYAQEVFLLTEPESIIITRYNDKFLFPERRIIMGSIPNDEIFQATQKLSVYYPVYYYNFYLNEADVNYLNDRKLPPFSLRIDLVKRISHQFGLYKFSLVKTEQEDSMPDVSLEVLDNNSVQ